MTLKECTAILTPFVLALRADFDEPTYRAYHKFLEDVSAEMLQAALEAERLRGDLRFMLNAPELRAKCELQRRQLLALHAWTPCIECQDSPRWRTVIVDDVERMQKCPCVARHVEKLAGMGIDQPICALPSTASEGPGEQDYPTRDQLPAGVQDRLDTVIHQRRIR